MVLVSYNLPLYCILSVHVWWIQLEVYFVFFYSFF